MKQTQKKMPNYFTDRNNKRFSRKNSIASEKSIQQQRQVSRQKIKEYIPDNHYLKTPTNSYANLSKMFRKNDFFTDLASQLKQGKMKNQSMMLGRIQESRISKDNYLARVESLEVEREIQEQELEILRAECHSFRNTLKIQKQTKKELQLQNKQLHKQLQHVSKKFQEISLNNKKLDKEKEYLIKQLQFLQKINYDEKTRHLQSYREKYLETELSRLRQELKKSKSMRQKLLDEELTHIKQQNYSLQQKMRALNYANQTMMRQLTECVDDHKDMVFQSSQYKKLRDKYKRILDEYKNLRTQNWSLKNKVNVNLEDNQSSLFNLTVSMND